MHFIRKFFPVIGLMNLQSYRLSHRGGILMSTISLYFLFHFIFFSTQISPAIYPFIFSEKICQTLVKYAYIFFRYLTEKYLSINHLYWTHSYPRFLSTFPYSMYGQCNKSFNNCPFFPAPGRSYDWGKYAKFELISCKNIGKRNKNTYMVLVYMS